MESLLKPGKSVDRKIKSAVNRWKAAKKLPILAVITVFLLTPLACSGGFIMPADLTATAVSPAEEVLTGSLEVNLQETPKPVPVQPTSTQPVIPPTPEPTITLAPTTQITVPALPVLPTDVSTEVVSSETTGPAQDAPILYYTQAGDTLKGARVTFQRAPGRNYIAQQNPPGRAV